MSLRRVDAPTIQPTQSGGVEARRSTGDGEGLDAIRGQGTLPGGTAAANRTGAADAGGVAHLHTINGKAPLATVSGKSDAIYAALGDDLSAKLDARLAGASKAERKDMEKLLHFAWNGRGDTTSAERLTARTAVAAYLAEGGGVGGARLMRDRMLELSANDASRVISNLKDDEGHPIDRLAKPPLFNPKAQDAPEVFQRTAAILLDFPAVPADAGKTAIANDRVALARDQNGQLQIRNMAMGFTRVGVPDGNTGFSAQKLQDVRDVFDQVASKPYSTQGIVLDFMRFFRETNQARAANGEAPLSLAEARQRYQPDGNAITDRFNGRGNCMGHAEKIVAELAKIGVTAHIVGHYTANLIDMNDPGSTDRDAYTKIPGAEAETGRVTHLDIIVPFKNDQNQERLLLISPGVGTTSADAWQEFPLAKAKTDGYLAHKRVEPGQTGVDASESHKATLSYRSNIQLLSTGPDDDPAQKKLAGIDLIGGTVYLNRTASDDYRTATHGPHATAQANGAVSFNFKDAIANPTAPVTVKAWNAQTNAYEDRQTTKLAAFLAFATAIKDQFGQPDDFVDDLLTLAQNYDSYKTDILKPALSTLADVNDARGRALRDKPADDSPKLAGWTQHFEAAGERVLAGDAETARRHYQVASSIANS